MRLVEAGGFLVLEGQPLGKIVLPKTDKPDKVRREIEKEISLIASGRQRKNLLTAAYRAVNNYFLAKAKEEEEGKKRGPQIDLLPKKEGALRDVIAFSWILPLYSKPRLSLDEEGELRDVKTEWRLYAGYLERAQPPIIIYDADGFVNVKRLEYALTKVDEETLKVLETAAPRRIFLEAVGKHNLTIRGGEHPARILWQSGLLVQPVPRLKDASFLKGFDWGKYVDNLINFNNIRLDPRLVVIRKAHLMRGIKQSINPHTILTLPGQTGKSEWYRQIGILEDKVGANSLIGYADADGPKPGSVDGAELPFAIDQIESSGMYKIFRYLLGLMESGVARVDMAAIPFTVRCTSPFIIISNPIGDPKNDFAVLIEKMSRNPALGRRFGIILYDTDAVRIQRREKNIEVLKKEVGLFRAVEEYCWPTIKKIVHDDKVWDWLNTKNKEWTKQAKEAVLTIENNGSGEEQLVQFLLEFVENGQAHTRGGALRAALTYNLDLIALRDYNINDLLLEAEEYLAELLEINFNSITKIAESYQEVAEEAALRLFDRLPTYLKEIVSAIELWRRSLTPEDLNNLEVPLRFYINTLDYRPKSTTYFSDVIKLAKRSNPEKYNEELKRLLGFELKKEKEGIVAVVSSLQPIEKIEPLGSGFSDILDISDKVSGEGEKKTIGFSNGEPVSEQSKEVKTLDKFSEKSSSDKVEAEKIYENFDTSSRKHVQNVRNVRKEIDIYRCRDCRFYERGKCLKHREWVVVTPDHPACELFEPKEKEEGKRGS